MSQSISGHLSASLIQLILSNISQQLRNKQLECIGVPKSLTSESMNMLMGSFNPMVSDYQPNFSSMQQQKLQDVIILEKDSLMPKGVDKQTEIDKYSMNNDSFIPKIKKLNQTRRSQHSMINSMKRTNKTSGFSVGASGNRKKTKESFLISLDERLKDQNNEQLDIEPLRKVKELQIRQNNKIKHRIEQRKKAFDSHQENFNSQFKQKQFTYDFEGSVVGSELQNSERIHYHSMRMKLSGIQKKNQSNMKFIGSKEPSKIVGKSHNKFKKDSLNTSNEDIQMAVNIPVFDTDGGQAHYLGIPTDRSSCRLKQYKKYYGGRFTRLERQSQTIDLGKNHTQQYEQLFKSKRYIKDDDPSINNSYVTRRSIDNQHRRLALPKIKGKYSTLDRYQYHDN